MLKTNYCTDAAPIDKNVHDVTKALWREYHIENGGLRKRC